MILIDAQPLPVASLFKAVPASAEPGLCPACAIFVQPGPPAARLGAPPALQLGLLDQALVLVRQQMAVHLGHRVHGDRHDDQE
jgi:hypothetical protein